MSDTESYPSKSILFFNKIINHIKETPKICNQWWLKELLKEVFKNVNYCVKSLIYKELVIPSNHKLYFYSINQNQLYYLVLPINEHASVNS